MKKNNKIILTSSVTIFILILAVLVYYIFSFVNKELLVEVEIPNKDYNIEIYYVDSGALSDNVIQVKKVYNIFSSEVITNIEGFQTVKSWKLLNPSTIKLIVGFPKTTFPTREDTVLIKF